MKPTRRNNILAGAFLVTALLLAVFLSFLLSDALDRVGTFNRYVLRFDLSEGATGIKRGSPLTLGGQQVGRVTEIETATRPGPTVDGEVLRIPYAIDVTVAVEKDVVLFDNARARIELPLLGTLSSINISSVGGEDLPPALGNESVALLNEGGMLDASVGSSIGDAVSGAFDKFDVEPAQIGRIVDNVEITTANAKQITGDLAPYIKPAAKDVFDTIERFKAFSLLINERTDPLFDRADSIAENADVFVGGLPPLLDDVRLRVDEAGGLIERGSGFVDTAQGVLDENRPMIRETVTNVRDMSERFRTQTVDKFESLLDEGVLVAANAGDTVERVNLIIDQETPGISRTLANARLVSDRAVLFFEEISAAPWRLLQRPGNKEFREEVLYNAARAYASAVADLRDSSASLDAALTGLGPGGPAPSGALNPERVAAMAAELERAFENYRQQERQLLELFVGSP